MTLRIGDITPEEIEIGKPNKKSLWDKVRANDINHEERLAGLEGGASKVDVFSMEVGGAINQYDASELLRVATFRATSSFDIINVTITLTEAGSDPSGTLEFDLLRSSDGGATFTSIMDVLPSLTTVAVGDTSTNGFILLGNERINQNDLLTINITQIKPNQKGFFIHVFGENS